MAVTISNGVKDANGANSVNGVNGANGANSANGHYNKTSEKHLMSGAAKLRHMLQDPNDLIVCPGVYDGLSARIALNLGFEAMYMVCVQVSALKYLWLNF